MPAKRASGFAERSQAYRAQDAIGFAPANRKRLSAPALRTFMAIADVWGLNEAQRLLVLGVLFVEERFGVDWLRGPHQALVFGGRPPLELVTNGSQDGLLTARRFLDAARGGPYMQPNSIDIDFAPYEDSEIVFR
jgi:hypothetical protein